jgi:glycosyltransferase involved in cell wall biosynthesis
MPGIIAGKARICIVNYKTAEFTKVCLRAVRKFTDCPYEVVVVDNDSQDKSVEYLRSLPWIRLIERKPKPGEPRGSWDEGSAYDMALADCNTEFFVVMHSDTIVIKPGWLTELIAEFRNDPKFACVGSGKVELEPMWRTVVKKVTDFRTFKRKLFGDKNAGERYRYHNRTICCLYRTEVLKSQKLSFLMDHHKKMTTGHKLYLELLDRGFKTVELPVSRMRQYVIHLTHATQVVNPAEFPMGERAYRKWKRIIDNIMRMDIIQSLLKDDSLDR